MNITYVNHGDAWVVGWWDAKGRWQQHSKHHRRSDAVAEIMKVRAKERIDAITDTSPSDHVHTGSISSDPPL